MVTRTLVRIEPQYPQDVPFKPRVLYRRWPVDWQKRAVYLTFRTRALVTRAFGISTGSALIFWGCRKGFIQRFDEARIRLGERIFD
jgi:hypothetical protein